MTRALLLTVASCLASNSLGAEPLQSKNTPETSPLLEKGSLDEVRKLLERIFRFSFAGDNLKIGREEPSLEIKGRLERIVAAHPEDARQSQGLITLQLYRDPKFLISLLDHVAREQVSPIVRELERATGQKLGAEAAAWKEWATKNLNQD
jgi:hypothetical protein